MNDRAVACPSRPTGLAFLAAIALGLFATDGIEAQEPAALRGRNQFTLTAHTLGLTAAYARAVGSRTLVGGQIGGGGDGLSVMLLGGRHFGEWLTWEERDAPGGEWLIEIVHAGAFLRRTVSERFDYDVGVRASVFLHFDDSDDDPGGGGFIGAFGTAMFGWRHFKVGPRLQVGIFDEGSGASEPGVYLAPITARVTFIW